MDIVLSDKEVRVLGCLIEKELATPEYYPLSFNALTTACNQKSSRDPVVSYEEETVEEIVDDLVRKELVHKSHVGRVPKVEERLTHAHNLVPRESAVLCVLLLRGPQTAGEIKGRTTRLCTFETLDEVHETLSRLEEYGFAGCLPRQPGRKESRYSHLLCGEPPIDREEAPAGAGQEVSAESERIAKIEQDIQTLRNDVAELKREFDEFKKQFY
ncbi:MAG: YceH family protein [Desulfobacterales bacterium]